jgi:HlyD family secretion protein
MDIPRPDQARKIRRRRILSLLGGLAVISLITAGLARLKPAPPSVEKGSLLIDTVKRGDFTREVRGTGTLVPEDIRWITTLNAGRVERVLVLPGSPVKADTVLVELSNPDVQQAALDAEWALNGAEAEMTNLHVTVATQKLTQQSAVASAEASYDTAKLECDVNEDLSKGGLVSALTLKESETKMKEQGELFKIEKERLRMEDESAAAQIAVKEANLAQLRAARTLKRGLVEKLKIRAGMDGVLQRYGDLSQTTPLQVGQQLGAGAIVARVANQARLKAVLKIPETQVKDITFNQLARIDTRNGVVPGHVVRIDPASENGTVTVDVALDAPPPKGARPDLSVDGTIELEHLQNVLHVGRPVQGQPESRAGLFKVVDNGRGAVRVQVGLGRSSVTTIEILDGLQVGDQVILSDMSQWDAFERVRLN